MKNKIIFIGLIISTVLFFNQCTQLPTETDITEDNSLKTVQGTIITSDFSTSQLKIITANNGPQVLNNQNEFFIKIKERTNQLVFVMDETDSLVALSFIYNENGEERVYPVGKESTTLALIMLSPGLIASNVDSVNLVIQRLKGMNEFAPIMNYVNQNFAIGIANMVNNPIYQNYLIALIKKYFNVYKDYIPDNSGSILTNRWEKNQFEVVKFRTENVLTNYAWRFVAVWRTDEYSITSDRTDIDLAMPGATGFSLYSLFKWTWNHGTRREDKGFQESDSLLRARYHIYGPGFKRTYEQTDYDDPKLWAYSIGYYVAFPVLSIIGGFTSSDAVKMVIDVVNELFDAGELYEDVENLRRSDNDQDRIDFVQKIALKILTKLIEKFIPVLGQLIGAAQISITAANVYGFVYTIATLQPYSTITFYLKENYSNAGLIAHYPFDGNANDVSGNGLHGIQLNEVTPTEDRLGNPGKALYFNGATSYVELPYQAINNLSEGTFMAWINIAELNKQHTIVDKTITGASNDFQIIVHTNNKIRVNIDVQYGEILRLYSNQQLQANTWYHIAVTWNGQEWKIYINGNLDASAQRNQVVPSSNKRVFVGKVDSNIAFFHGKIDDIRVFSYELTSEEIKNIMNSTN